MEDNKRTELPPILYQKCTQMLSNRTLVILPDRIITKRNIVIFFFSILLFGLLDAIPNLSFASSILNICKVLAPKLNLIIYSFV